MIRKIFAGAFALVAATCALSPASAANLAVKDANSVTQALCEKTASDGSLIACHAIYDTTLTQIDPATKQYQISILSALGSPFQAGGQIGNTAFGAKLLDATGAAFGTSSNPVYVTGISGSGTASSVTINGTLPAYASPPTFNIGTAPTLPVSATALPLPAGASTAANQTAANTALAAIAGYTKPATSFSAITVGTAFTPGIGLAAICTAAGNIVLNGSDGSAITVPVNIGFNQFGFGVAKVASQTATCTFTNLL